MIRRLSWVAAGVVVVVVALVAFVGLFMLRQPGPLEGTTTTLHLETVAAVGQALEWPRPNDPHPDWVGYLPTTTWTVPANSTIQVTIDQEDGATEIGAGGQGLEWPRPNDPHPDWVGYLPTTTWTVPANSTIQVTIDQEDGATGLRNPFWGKVFGTEGGNMHVTFFDD